MNYTQSQQKDLVKQLRQLLSGKRNATRRSITQLIGGYLGFCGEAYPSQTTLGDKAGVKRETANRSLKTLHNKIIIVDNRGYKKTCRYWYTSEFLNHRHHFYDLIPALRQISLLLLFSITSNVYSRNVTQYKELTGAKRQSKFAMLKIKQAGYGFYEKGYSEEIQTLFYIPTTTTPYSTITSKERVMDNEQTVINCLSDTYGLSVSQQDMLSNYSEEALQYAFNELKRQNKQHSLNNPVNWIAKVAAAYKGKAQRFPKTGKMGGHSSTATNPNGHSPAQELPNLTHMEQIEYLVKEILKFSKTFDPNKVYSPDPQMDEYLKKLAMNSIAGMQREVDQLLASLDDPNHICKTGCVDQSLFLRKQKQQSDVDFTQSSADKDYEEHLNAISDDKSDSAGYKELVRKYDYRRIAR